MNNDPIFGKRLCQARRRLLLQEALNRLIMYWAAGLAVAIVAVLVAPFMPAFAKPVTRAWLLVGLFGAGLLLALVNSIRRAPTLAAAALAVDRRFHLQERVTTALALTPHEAASPAGVAVLADASQRLAPLAIRSRFPIQLGRKALALPIQVAVLAVAMLFFKPMLDRLNAENSKPKPETAAAYPIDNPAAAATTNPPRPIAMPPERANKSEELRQLEEELKQLYADANKPNDPARQEVLAQKMEEIAAVQDRLRKFERQRGEKLQRLQEQMQKLGQFDPADNGPAKALNDAMSKGDLEKAKKEVDELKKKIKGKKLDPKDTEQLKEELQKLQQNLEKLARNEQEQKKLQDLIDKAKREGRDAESLERELKQIQDETKQLSAMKQLADKLGDIKQSLENQDFDSIDKNLGDLARQLGDLNDSLGDLDDVEEHLQNLKDLKDRLAGKCRGKDCEGNEGGDGDLKDDSKSRGQASGKRPENPNAASDFEERRQRSRFDAKGRKTYGGAVNGPAFTKKSTIELVGEIKQAAQEAPNAIEVQRLPRSAREMVKEYFENLGGESQKQR